LRLLSYLFLSTFVLGNLATYLRRKRSWPDGYTRKLNHFGHMLISTPLLAFLPMEQLLPSVLIASVAVVVIYGVSACSRRPWLHGIVAGSLRDRDAPHSRFFFFMPLVAGNVGLVVAAASFPIELVRIAFFTVAFADGFAEPVGLRFGRTNGFRVPDPLWRRHNTKSVAGSSAVFLWSLVIAVVVLSLGHGLGPAVLAISLAYAVSVTSIEALSPRGMDNMLLFLLGPALLGAFTQFLLPG
jgi:dolichol kinase